MGKQIYTVEAANARLKVACIKIKIEVRGNSLALRGTFPPKPGSGKVKSAQQRIPLGWPNVDKGVKKAEAQAILTTAQLIDGSFRWDDHIDGSDRNPLIVRDLVKKFEQHYRSRNALADRTWRKSWLCYYRQLPQDQKFSGSMARKFVESKPEYSKTRRNACHKMQHLLDYCNIDLDLSELRGSYGKTSVKRRELPTDELIAEWRDRIPNKGWQWIYGMMAAGGLRPHECFFCDWTDDGLQILKGKTGPRLVHSLFYPEWVDEWNLRDVHLPNTDFEKLYEKGNLGARMLIPFRQRYGLPFELYALRHATAVRMSVVFELPITTSAALLGHDPAVHLATYQKYITDAQVKASVIRALSKANRPKPPS